MENNFEPTAKSNVVVKENIMKKAFGDLMAPLHGQNLMFDTNSNAQKERRDEPDPQEVKIYVDNIISGAIEKINQEKPKAFKNKVTPAEGDVPGQKFKNETRNKKAKKRGVTFKQRFISMFLCCCRKED